MREKIECLPYYKTYYKEYHLAQSFVLCIMFIEKSYSPQRSHFELILTCLQCSVADPDGSLSDSRIRIRYNDTDPRQNETDP